LIVKPSGVIEIELRVKELAAASIHAEAGLVELQAGFGFEVGWKVLLLHQLMITVSERASAFKVASAGELPVFAHFCLKLHFVLGDESFSIRLRIKVAFRFLYCGKLSVLIASLLSSSQSLLALARFRLRFGWALEVFSITFLH
jgi:hypothetical protein